jgi:glycosyltransferase 2 family protein
VPTSLLMPVVRVTLLRREGVPRRSSLSATVHELALAFAAALIVSAYFLLTLPSLADEPMRFALLALPLVLAIALNPRVFEPLARYALRRMGQDAGDTPVTMDERHLLPLLVGYIASFLIGGLALFALARAFTPVALDDLPTVVMSLGLGYSAALVAPILPGGIGAREAGLTAALATVLGGPTALAVAVASRILQLVIELGFAAAVIRVRAAPELSPDAEADSRSDPPARAPAATAGVAGREQA